MDILSPLVHGIEYLVVGYTLLYGLTNIVLILMGFNPAREEVRSLSHSDLDLMDEDEFCPSVSILVPAYNEEVTIVDSVRAFTELDYASFEIIVINDGSTDATAELLRERYRMQRRDVAMRSELHSAHVRGVYVATCELPPGVDRLLLLDKENGGCADALNAGINAAQCPYFISVDADSMLDPNALKMVMRVFEDDPEVLAVGGQIGIVNDCKVERGRVIELAPPRSYLTLCQALEYMRSFTTMRTGFSRFNGLLILSGAFLLLKRSTAVAVGGFLTRNSRSRLQSEYAGVGNGTVGEDMELIVRLHRFEREVGRTAKVVHTPMPVCWTEVPSSWNALGKQRRRWHRGLLEILRFHRDMICNPGYGRLGTISMPYITAFEAAGPYVEALGYFALPILALAGFLDPLRWLLITVFALGMGVLQTSVSLMCATWLEPVSPAGTRLRSLAATDHWRDRAWLLLGCVAGELGYRQMTVLWRLWGTFDFLSGRTTWDKFERRGFQAAQAALLAALIVLWPSPSRGDSLTGVPGAVSIQREAALIAGTEHREGLETGWWLEALNRWDRGRESESFVRGGWLGFYRIDREFGHDTGFIGGASLRLGETAGLGAELRLAPGASITPSSMLHLEAEALVRRPVSATLLVRHSRYSELTLLDLAPGGTIYLPGDSWLSLRMHTLITWFDAGARSTILGGSALASRPWGRVELRGVVSYGGENYLVSGRAFADEIRAWTMGLTVRWPLSNGWGVEHGLARRRPDQGNQDLYLHAGVRRSW